MFFFLQSQNIPFSKKKNKIEKSKLADAILKNLLLSMIIGSGVSACGFMLVLSYYLHRNVQCTRLELHSEEKKKKLWYSNKNYTLQDCLDGGAHKQGKGWSGGGGNLVPVWHIINEHKKEIICIYTFFYFALFRPTKYSHFVFAILIINMCIS